MSKTNYETTEVFLRIALAAVRGYENREEWDLNIDDLAEVLRSGEVPDPDGRFRDWVAEEMLWADALAARFADAGAGDREQEE